MLLAPHKFGAGFFAASVAFTHREQTANPIAWIIGMGMENKELTIAASEILSAEQIVLKEEAVPNTAVIPGNNALFSAQNIAVHPDRHSLDTVNAHAPLRGNCRKVAGGYWSFILLLFHSTGLPPFNRLKTKPFIIGNAPELLFLVFWYGDNAPPELVCQKSHNNTFLC